MFIEKREHGKNSKYYLIHTYRQGDSIKRVFRYLGSNLSKKDLEKLSKRAEVLILEQIKDRNILNFELSSEEVDFYKKYDKKIEIEHFQKKVNWERFTNEFVYNTNAIEGSTVSLQDANLLLEKKEKPANTDEVETIEVGKAVDYLLQIKKQDLSLEIIQKLHYLCFNKTKHFASKFRNVEVVIRDRFGNVIHRGAPAKDVAKLLIRLIDWYNKYKNKYPPLLLAALLHNYFEEIHPFQDGNGRIGRLLLNYVLLGKDYPPVNVRLKDRQEYYNALQRFDKNYDVKPMIKFLIKEYKKQYR